jgi:ParB family chromosome partitioning protein
MATVAYKKGKLYDLPIGDLNPDPNQPRKSMDPQALEELTASVKTYGIIQPLLFRVDADSSNLIIVAGERRCEAAKKAGLTEVPAILVEGKHGEIALVENLGKNEGLRPFFRPFGKWGAVPVFSPWRRPRPSIAS